jgi:hypothetical protein
MRHIQASREPIAKITELCRAVNATLSTRDGLFASGPALYNRLSILNRQGRLMEIAVNFEFVNWWRVLSATVAAFVLGGIWYSPSVFGRLGLSEARQTEVHEDRDRNIQLIFVIAFLFQWLTASLMAAVLGPNATIRDGIITGLLVGFFFVSTALGISAIFDKRPIVRIFVNGSYHVVTFTVMGALLGWG